jgi:sec-independent protein translocase protein TatB
MFDIGFSELFVIAVVALIVIGPERLPKVARTLGHMLGRLQRYVAEVKSDVAREIELEELRKFKSEMEDTARSFERTVRDEVREAEQRIQKVAKDAEAEVSGVSPGSAPASSSPQLELSLPEAPKSAEGGR